MNMYKAMMKNQTTFFSFPNHALEFFKGRFELTANDHGLCVLKLDGSFLASFNLEEKDDTILYYTNRQISREIA